MLTEMALGCQLCPGLCPQDLPVPSRVRSQGTLPMSTGGVEGGPPNMSAVSCHLEPEHHSAELWKGGLQVNELRPQGRIVLGD